MTKKAVAGFLVIAISFAIGPIAWAQKEAKGAGSNPLDETGCSDHPLFARMNGFYIESCNKNYDGIEVLISEDDSKILEGAHTQIQYVLDEDNVRQAPSLMQVTRTYEQLAVKMGGRKIYADDFGYITFTAKKDATELWVIVSAIGRSAVTALTLDILEVGVKEKKAPDNLQVATMNDQPIVSSATTSLDVAQETIPSTPTIPPKIGGPTAPEVTLPTSTPGLVIEHISWATAAEVNQGLKAIDILRNVGEEIARPIYSILASALGQTYARRVQQRCIECLNRTYTAADNLSAGCTEGESPASRERKLLNWCMQSDVRFKPERDQLFNQLNHLLQQLQGAVQQYGPQAYPQ
jgi:hypothetical protein